MGSSLRQWLRRSPPDVVYTPIDVTSFTFEEMVRLIGTAVGARSRLVHTSPVLALGLTRVLGTLMKDVVLTSDEIKGLMAGLLDTTCPPTGTTELSTWLQKNSAQLGDAYVSEVRRNWG